MEINSNLQREINNFLKGKIEQITDKAIIISAYKLSDEEMAKIKNTFTEIKDKQLENQIDETIVGGFIIKYGSYVIDLSIKGRLNNFKKIFYEVS